MNKFNNSGAGRSGKGTSSLRKMLTDGTGSSPAPLTSRTRGISQFLIPALLVLVLLIGVGILAYSFGVSRGKNTANAERDRFYEGRAASWNATATAVSQGQTTPGAVAATNGFSYGNAVFGRVDKVEGDRVTALLLDQSGKPTGANLLVVRTKQTQVWRSIPDQPTELRPGDTILFTGERNNENGQYEARSILVLPPNS